MKEWWWSKVLAEEGHRFEHREWRCADCRRPVLDLLVDRRPCRSPEFGGSYVFVGGPFDGRWQSIRVTPTEPPPQVFPLLMPLPLPTAIEEDLDDVPETRVFYRLTRHTVGPKVMFRYVFEE